MVELVTHADGIQLGCTQVRSEGGGGGGGCGGEIYVVRFDFETNSLISEQHSCYASQQIPGEECRLFTGCQEVSSSRLSVGVSA